MHPENQGVPISLIKIKEVKGITGLGVSTIYAKAAIGEFPAPIKLTQKSSAWVLSEVQEWIKNRITESRAA